MLALDDDVATGSADKADLLLLPVVPAMHVETADPAMQNADVSGEVEAQGHEYALGM